MPVLRRLQHGEAHILATGIIQHPDASIVHYVGQEPDWKIEGLCNEVGTELFYPPNDDPDTERAKRICKRCTVIDQCLEYALKNNEPYGVWGGKTPAQRRRMRSAQRVHRRVETVKARQSEALRLSRSGLSAPQVAERMGVTARTVERWKSANRMAETSIMQ